MIHQIAHEVYRAIRQHGNLKVGEVAAAMGKKHQAVWRIEKGEQMASRAQETILIEKANLSSLAFVEIMCKVLSKFLGRRVMIAPRGQYLPTSPLARAADHYSLHHENLSSGVRERIEAKLHQGRMIEAVADQSCALFEKEIRQLIEDECGTRGRGLGDTEV